MFRQMDSLKKKKLKTLSLYFCFWLLGLLVAIGCGIFTILSASFFEIFTNIPTRTILTHGGIALGIILALLLGYTVWIIIKCVKKIRQLQFAA